MYRETHKQEVLRELESMRNIGPAMADKLYRLGITSREELETRGSEEVYMAMYQQGLTCSTPHVAYPYALEGAITDTDWRKIPPLRKVEIKALCAELKSLV